MVSERRASAETMLKQLCWIVVCGLPGCTCDDPGSPLARMNPEIRVFSPDSPQDLLETLVVDFGAVPTGAVLTRAVGVKNVGDAVLHVCTKATDVASPTHSAGGCPGLSRIEPTPSAFSFSFENLDSDGAWIVPDAAAREFVVRFSPNEDNDATATLILVSDAANGPNTLIELRGEGVPPRLDLSPEVIDFGEVTVGRRVELGMTIQNGTRFVQPIHFEAIAQDSVVFGMIGPAGVSLAHDQALDLEVPGNAARTLGIFFQPPSEGVFENILRAAFCSRPECARAIRLVGKGIRPAFALEPDVLDFGVVRQGEAAARSFVVRNVGSVQVAVKNVALEMGTSSEFMTEVAAALPAALAPGDDLAVTVRYQGSAPGSDGGRVEVVTDAWDDPVDPIDNAIGFVTLKAVTSGPDITAMPSSVNFSTVAIGGPMVTRALIVSNVGNAALTIAGYALRSDPPTTELSVTNVAVAGTPASFPLVLEPGTSVDLQLGYSPTNAGPDRAELVFQSDDPDEGSLSVPVVGTGGVPTQCSISVAPSELTFGLVERGRNAVLPVELRNGGALPCRVSNMSIGGSGEFALGAGALAMTVPPGARQRVDITYAPADYGADSATFAFDVDDPAQPRVEVPVSGASAESDVLVIPSQVDFNVVRVRCGSPVHPVTIYNTGSSAVVVSGAYLDASTSSEFELAPYPANQTLPPGGQSVINLRYRPQDIGPDTGLLFVVHSAASFPVAVPLTGEGKVSPAVTDVFQQLPAPQADVLFVVDDSGSMEEEQASLGANLGSFLTYARTAQIDYQIAVTTTDVTGSGEQGRFVGSPAIITRTTPNAEQVFARSTNVGTSGSGVETGLHAAYLALSDPLINTTNRGFVRPDAALAIIFVSDEEDQSPQPQTFYEAFFRNIKGFANRALFSASAVVGDRPMGCTGPGGQADYGAKYIVTAQATGGVVESICSANWGQALANIGATTFGLKRQFTLSSVPVPSTIQVKVNGVTVPSSGTGGVVNWSYSSTSNLIGFEVTSTPQAGASIEVTYTVGCLP